MADYAACVTQNECPDVQCAYENCLDKAYQCIVGGLRFDEPPRADVCACLGDCSGDGRERCLADTSMEAEVMIYRELIVCFLLNDCDAPIVDSCAACAGAIEACLASD